MEIKIPWTPTVPFPSDSASYRFIRGKRTTLSLAHWVLAITRRMWTDSGVHLCTKSLEGNSGQFQSAFYFCFLKVSAKSPRYKIPLCIFIHFSRLQYSHSLNKYLVNVSHVPESCHSPTLLNTCKLTFWRRRWAKDKVTKMVLDDDDTRDGESKTV